MYQIFQVSSREVLRVKLHQRDERTNERTDRPWTKRHARPQRTNTSTTIAAVSTSLRLDVPICKRRISLSVCPLCLSIASMLSGERSAMLRRNLSWGIKIRNKPINTRNLITLLSKKALKYCHQMPHVKAKMDQIRFLASVRLSVRSFVRLFDGVWHLFTER